MQEAQERGAELRQGEDIRRRRRELRRGIVEGEAQLAVLQDELSAERAELERIAGREERHAADAEAARSAMAARRWADSAQRDEAQRDQAQPEAPRDEGGRR